jgi:polygalacturonase
MSKIDVRSFGAVGDGVTLDTLAIQRAIDSLEKGDTLVFSDGSFVTGTLALKSDITILIEDNAEICGSRNFAHYRDCGFYHNEMIQTVSLIYALNCENITFCGKGKIQLSGDAFMKFNTYHHLPDEIDPATMTKDYTVQTVVAAKERPTQPIFFDSCKHVHMEGIFVCNAPCWGLVFSNCEDVTLEDLYVDNHARIPNNDGVHFSASKDIVVKNCTFLCGDDCIAATCITNWNGVCENIEITDCLLSSRSAAIRLGHLSSHVRNVRVNNVKILPSTRAIIIFAGDGGKVEHIEVENLTAETCIHTGDWWGKGEGFVLCAKNSNGEISDITFKNCSFIQENPSIIAGEAGNISNVTLLNCEHTYRKGNAHPYYIGKIDLQPNVPGLGDAPFQAEDQLYVTENGCRNLQVK